MYTKNQLNFIKGPDQQNENPTGELNHAGRKGMKWGQQIFTKGKGGSGKKVNKSSKPKKRKISDMSEEELRAKVKRWRLEQDYRKLKKQNERGLKRAKNNIVKFVASTGTAAVGAFATQQSIKFLKAQVGG